MTELFVKLGSDHGALKLCMGACLPDFPHACSLCQMWGCGNIASKKASSATGKAWLTMPMPHTGAGIGDMRQAYQEKEDAKKLKQKQREKMAPKMGRMDIDYQVGATHVACHAGATA